MDSISTDLPLLLINLPLIVLLFLPVSLVLGGVAAFYAFILGRINNRSVSYAIPFVVLIVWSLWAAAQEIPGPMILIYNYGYMLLVYPMIVVSILPLANHIMKLQNSSIPALVVGTAVMLISLTMGGLGGEKLATIPAAPPTYFDNLAKVFVSWLSTMGYAIAGYAILAIIKVIMDKMNWGSKLKRISK